MPTGRKTEREAIMKKFFKKTEGFTLVELIVVIAILGILAGVGTVGYSGYIKKANEAADKTLLSSAATALTVAAIENNVDVKDLAGAQIVIEDGVVDADAPLDLSTTAAYKSQPASFNLRAASPAETFEAEMIADFLAGFPCEGVEFKYYSEAIFTKDGTFMGIAADSVFANLIDTILGNEDNEALITKVQNSAFYNIGSDALLTQVNDVAGLATDFIAAGQGKLYEAVMSEDYINSLATRLGMSTEDLMEDMAAMAEKDPNEFSRFMANSTVLNVAGTMNSETFDEEGTLEMFAEGNWGDLAKTLSDQPETGLAQVAMLYGLYTAYDQKAASNIALTQDVGALMDLMEDEDFIDYLSKVNTKDSEAYNNYQGYKSALDIVDQSASNKEVANQIMNNGYDDANLLALLQGVLGA